MCNDIVYIANEIILRFIDNTKEIIQFYHI